MYYLYYNTTETTPNKRFVIREQPCDRQSPNLLCIGTSESLLFIQGFIAYASLYSFVPEQLFSEFMEALKRAPFIVPPTPPPFERIAERIVDGDDDHLPFC